MFNLPIKRLAKAINCYFLFNRKEAKPPQGTKFSLTKFNASQQEHKNPIQ
jgi:hypothetical protein